MDGYHPGASGISEMTTALARLLKSISKGSHNRITLREELNLVKDYFLIQQYRYGGSISLECEISEEALYDCLITVLPCSLSIENALFHGIEPKGCAENPQSALIWTEKLPDSPSDHIGMG